MGAPTCQPLAVDRLARVPHIADIMIAGHRPKGHSQVTHQASGVSQIFLDIGAVDGDIAGMDHEVGALGGDPRRERRPIVSEMRLARAQMRVRDLNYPHASPQRNSARSGIRAKTREHPAAISRSAWSPGQWPPPQNPTTGIPAAIAASTPVKLSSTT